MLPGTASFFITTNIYYFVLPPEYLLGTLVFHRWYFFFSLVDHSVTQTTNKAITNKISPITNFAETHLVFRM